jgi:ADP-ribosyltransferase exoenzyme
MPAYDDEPRMTIIAAPATYPDTTAGPVRYVPIVVRGRTVAYLWAADDNDAAGVVHRTDVGPDGFNTAVAWVRRLRASRADQRTPLDAFGDWCRRVAEGCDLGELHHAPSLSALYQVAGRDLDAEQREQAREQAAEPVDHAGRTRSALLAYRRVQAAARGERPWTADPDPDPDLDRQIRVLDEALRVHPVPKDIWVWWAADRTLFARDPAELPGTVHIELGYLTVALVHHDALADAEALVRLRVPAGTPGIYLNPFDDNARLLAPTLLLARGCHLAVRSAERHDGQWRLEAEILRQRPEASPPTGPGAAG